MIEPQQPPLAISFRDYVQKLPHQLVLDNLISASAFGSGSGGTSRRIVSSAMVKEAADAFAAKASLSKRFKALSPALRLKCAQVYLMGGSGLSVADPSAYGKEPLLSSLLVFAAQGAGGVRLFGFEEFEPVLRPLMARELLAMGDAGECPAAPHPSFHFRPLSDVAAVCSLAFHGMLSRSVHGGLSRSALNALKRLVSDPTLSGRSISDGEPGHPAGFLIGYCLGESLIADADAGAGYALNRQNFAAWLGVGAEERMQRLAGYADEWVGGVGLELARELLAQGGGRWIAVNQIIPEADRAMFARALGVFEFLGYAHTGHAHGGLRFAPCSAATGLALGGEAARDTLVLPDFSVVIPQEVTQAELFDFAHIGVLIAFDKVYRGQITKESVSNSLSVGTDAEYLRSWLRVRRAAENVVKTVDEWIREFSRLYVSSGSSLISCDERVTRQIAALEPLRKHLTEVEAHTVFAIKPGSEEKVLDILEKLGFDTRAPDGEHSDSAKLDDKPTDAPKCAKRRITPLTEFNAAPDTPPPAMRRTKYGSGLKALEVSEMIHVVDYAMLTNQSLVIDYDGSAYIKQNIYTVVPLGIDKGIDAAVEAEIPYVRGRKQFFLNKIKRIGVVDTD